MNLRRRIAALERRLMSEPVLLTMPDGRTLSIPGRGDYLLKLLMVAARGENTSPEAAHLDLIRNSTSAIQSDGGRLIEVIRCCVLGPAEEGDESGETAGCLEQQEDSQGAQ